MSKWHEFERQMPDHAKISVLQETGIFPVNFWLLELCGGMTAMIDESGEDRYTVMLRDNVTQQWIIRVVGSEAQIHEWLDGVLKLCGGAIETGVWQ